MSGVYISIPFCAQKCTYCNFASGVLPRDLLADYIAALEAEISSAQWGRLPDTLYLGGGTPSLLGEDSLARILGMLPRVIWKEATIEAAPGTVTPEHVGSWSELGINRVSLGVQSFVARELAATGRQHSAEQVEQEVRLLRAAGPGNFNVDLIAGLPHQTAQSWGESLDWIERLDPPHVSVYMLEVDEDSRLGRELAAGGSRYGASQVPSDDQIADFYCEAVKRLDRIGIRRYEISNFARPGFESLHNLKYWRLEPYRGFGADAHSFDGSRRWSNVESAAEYVARFRAGQPPVAGAEAANLEEEHFFVGLRQAAGIEPSAEQWRRFAEAIRRLNEDGLLATAGSRLRLTDRGVLLSNLVFQEFLS